MNVYIQMLKNIDPSHRLVIKRERGKSSISTRGSRYTKVLDQDQLRPTKDQLGDQLETN